MATSLVHGQTICVVDDDEDFTAFCHRYLTSVGHTVRSYTCPQRFLSDPNALHADMYLIDLMLPEFDGINLVSMIRSNGSAGIIVVSGKMGPDAFTTALAAGADMFINKPVRADQIAQAITSLGRRVRGTKPSAPSAWRLNIARGSLLSPKGIEIKLGQLEKRILEALAQAGAGGCTRPDLARIAEVAPSVDDRNLDAAMFRLRRKIENATGNLAPFVTRHGKGYSFSAPLEIVSLA